MSNKCRGCIFEDEYRDMSAYVKLCDRYIDMERAIREHRKPGPCEYHITKREIIKLQNSGVLKGENNV